jgi:hypothetical protein
VTAVAEHLWRSGGHLEVRRTDGKKIIIREKETTS